MDAKSIALVDHSSKLLLFYSPRAASTLVISVFLESLNLLEQLVATSTDIHNDLHQKALEFQLNLSMEEVLEKYSNYQMIKFVRNPYHRAVSIYFIYLAELIDKGLGDTANSSFFDFLLSLKTYHDPRSEVFMHSRLQSSACDPYITKIIQVEHLEEEFQKSTSTALQKLAQSYRVISKRYQSEPAIKNKLFNSGLKCPFLGRTSLPELSQQYFIIPEKKYFYNDEIKILVEEIYGKDINSFGYEYPWPDTN